MINALHQIKPIQKNGTSFLNNNQLEKEIPLGLKGIRDAGMHNGNVSAFALSLKELHHKMLTEQESAKEGVLEYEMQMESSQNILQDENAIQVQKMDDIKNRHIPELKAKVKDIKSEIREIKAHPEKFQEDTAEKTTFYITLVLLLLITAYLWVFYGSAAFSAFFREIKFTQNAVFNSIFYADAWGEAYRSGIMALLLISLLPFVFLGLGFLVHKFLEKKSLGGYIILSGIVLVTFLFDGLLAYEITQKIYEAKALNMFQEMPPFSLGMAATDANFWSIIAAGFVVYIIWGLVMHFCMESKKNLDQIGLLLAKKTSHELELRNEISDKEKEIAEIENAIQRNKQEISANKNSGKYFNENENAIKRALTAYASGWAKYLTFAQFPDYLIAEIKKETTKLLNSEA